MRLEIHVVQRAKSTDQEGPLVWPSRQERFRITVATRGDLPRTAAALNDHQVDQDLFREIRIYASKSHVHNLLLILAMHLVLFLIA